jgi:NAD-dependent deacetylase
VILDNFTENIKKAVEILQQAKYIVALTGAGISTPSGIPDFRSAKTGLWQKDDPMKVASSTAFRYHPEVFFNWLRPLAEKSLAAEPNSAHVALAKMEQNGFLSAVITQNIDGLHQKAGSKNVIEVHGSMQTLRCLHCKTSFDLSDFQIDFIENRAIPKCPACQRKLKPDITLFEEMLPMDAWQRAEELCFSADVLLVVGSSLEVVPASQLPLYALEKNAKLIINTYSSTYLDPYADVLLPWNVTEVMPAILKELL